LLTPSLLSDLHSPKEHRAPLRKRYVRNGGRRPRVASIDRLRRSPERGRTAADSAQLVQATRANRRRLLILDRESPAVTRFRISSGPTYRYWRGLIARPPNTFCTGRLRFGRGNGATKSSCGRKCGASRISTRWNRSRGGMATMSTRCGVIAKASPGSKPGARGLNGTAATESSRGIIGTTWRTAARNTSAKKVLGGTSNS
jgi:hypothetical protein